MEGQSYAVEPLHPLPNPDVLTNTQDSSVPEISDTGSPKSPPDARVSPAPGSAPSKRNSSESSAVGPAFLSGEVQPCPAGQPSNPLNNVQPKARPGPCSRKFQACDVRKGG